MSEAFIPAAPATPAQEVTIDGWGTGTLAEIEHHLAQLKDELEGTKRDLEAAQKRDLERQPLVEAIEYIVERRIERWLDSAQGRLILGGLFEELHGPVIDAAMERALSDNTIEDWFTSSKYGRELLGSAIEEQLSSAIDSHVEAALENATVDVEAYIRL
jgi:hypothetical protein